MEGLRSNSFALNMSLKSNESFEEWYTSKIQIPKGLGQVRDENMFRQTSLEKFCRQIHEIIWHRFYYGMFYSCFFLEFYRTTCQNLFFLVAGGVLFLSNPSILEIFFKFSKILTLKPFDNLYVQILVTII